MQRQSVCCEWNHIKQVCVFYVPSSGSKILRATAPRATRAALEFFILIFHALLFKQNTYEQTVDSLHTNPKVIRLDSFPFSSSISDCVKIAKSFSKQAFDYVNPFGGFIFGL